MPNPIQSGVIYLFVVQKGEVFFVWRGVVKNLQCSTLRVVTGFKLVCSFRVRGSKLSWKLPLIFKIIESQKLKKKITEKWEYLLNTSFWRSQFCFSYVIQKLMNRYLKSSSPFINYISNFWKCCNFQNILANFQLFIDI